MYVVILTIVILLVLVLGYLIVKRVRRNHALKLLQIQSQIIVDHAFNSALGILAERYPNLQGQGQQIQSGDFVADIWGRGILVFEYQFPVLTSSVELDTINRTITRVMNETAANDEQVRHVESYPPFVVSDSWYLKKHLHIDIAYLVNQSTISYVQDMRKLDIESLAGLPDSANLRNKK